MGTIERVGSILRKASLQLDDLIHQSQSENDGEVNKEDPLEKAQALVELSNGLIVDRRLKRLREIHADRSFKVPKWFRDIFKNGQLTLDLVPTFAVEIENACKEFKDMQRAKLSIDLSPLDSLLEYSRPEVCQIRVTEKLRFTLISSDAEDENVFRSWRQPLVLTVAGSEHFNKRKVVLAEISHQLKGDFVCKTGTPLTDSRVKIVFINNTYDVTGDAMFVVGVYRRLMWTRNNYLTWKIVL